MRTAFLTLIVMVGISANAKARLGETAEQLVARYGQPLNEADQKADGDKIPLANVVFQKGGYEIDVTITNGLSVQETFKKINGGAITLDEARILLTANAQGREWEAPQPVEGDKLWTRDDSATARLSKDGTMTIRSRDLVVQESAAKKAEKSPSLDGF